MTCSSVRMSQARRQKGAMFLPARFREDMEGGIVLTCGQLDCIYAFPASGVREHDRGTASRAPSSKQARDWIRVMLSRCPIRRSQISRGASAVPADLRAYAGLGRELAVIGAAREPKSGTPRPVVPRGPEEVFSNTAEEIIPGMF